MAHSVAMLGLSGLVAMAALVAGAILGLLFGIPRANRERQPAAGANAIQGLPSSTPSSSVSTSAPLFRSNTNLEEISDWLTKIIVGLGLVHLAHVPGYVRQLTGFLSRSGNIEGSEAFTPNVVLAVVVAFGGCGFFIGYLMTRLFLLQAFVRAENESSEVGISQLMEEAVEEAVEGAEQSVPPPPPSPTSPAAGLAAAASPTA